MTGTKTVVINPVLVYWTFLAGRNEGRGSRPELAVDQSGNVYVAGSDEVEAPPRPPAKKAAPKKK